ncbi:MAG: hypothetical protein HQ567_30405 [Candidatus Nealsonbacteria bacterium]|nr:hypothetical protein [Candidatus Nealsonbacteria bacterium]
MTGPVSTLPRSKGFSVIEITVVSALMSFLVLLISGAWSGMGRPSADAIVRCRVVQEANLAVDSLTRDLGGSLQGQTTGERKLGRMVGRTVVGGSQLRLCFDGEPINAIPDWNAPDTVITYDVQANRLVRSNLQTGTAFTVAANVDQMQLTELPDGVRIDLTFTYRDITRTYSIIAKSP